jgi:hypothetical protein
MAKSKAQQGPRERRQSTPEVEMALAEQVSAAVLEQAGDCACPGGMRGPVIKVGVLDVCLKCLYLAGVLQGAASAEYLITKADSRTARFAGYERHYTLQQLHGAFRAGQDDVLGGRYERRGG